MNSFFILTCAAAHNTAKSARPTPRNNHSVSQSRAISEKHKCPRQQHKLSRCDSGIRVADTRTHTPCGGGAAVGNKAALTQNLTPTPLRLRKPIKPTMCRRRLDLRRPSMPSHTAAIVGPMRARLRDSKSNSPTRNANSFTSSDDQMTSAVGGCRRGRPPPAICFCAWGRDSHGFGGEIRRRNEHRRRWWCYPPVHRCSPPAA